MIVERMESDGKPSERRGDLFTYLATAEATKYNVNDTDAPYTTIGEMAGRKGS
jgi:hypothetical protein